jgi:NADH-quinone oxidoreductase subunit C
MDSSGILDQLRLAVPGATIDVLESIDMTTLVVDREHLLAVGLVLRDDPSLQFALLVDVTAVDRLPAEPRFEIVYHMACVGEAYLTAGATTAAAPRRLRLKVMLSSADTRIPSVVSVWPTAGWPEREVFDLFGISFDGHPDLRRILMPDDWDGFPLRRDYPVQIRKDAASWSPLQLTVEEFARNIRAGHEKAVRQARPTGPKADSRE